MWGCAHARAGGAGSVFGQVPAPMCCSCASRAPGAYVWSSWLISSCSSSARSSASSSSACVAARSCSRRCSSARSRSSALPRSARSRSSARRAARASRRACFSARRAARASRRACLARASSRGARASSLSARTSFISPFVSLSAWVRGWQARTFFSSSSTREYESASWSSDGPWSARAKTRLLLNHS